MVDCRRSTFRREVHEGAEAVGIEDLVGHLQHVVGGHRFDGMKCFLQRPDPVVHQDALAHGRHPARPALGPERDLPDDLLLGLLQRHHAEPLLAGVAQLLHHEPLRAGKRLDVGPEIHGELAGVGVGEVAALDVVADAVALADVEVEPGVHAGPAEVVGQQHQRRPLRVVHPVPRAADHGVHLVDGMVPFAAYRRVPARRCPLAPRGLRLPLRKVLLRQPLHLFGRHGAHRAEDEPVVAVLALDEPQHVLAPEARHRLLRPEDVAAQRMAGEQHLLELVEDGVAGVVPPRVDLVDDDVALLGDLPLGKGRMEGDVGDQLHRAPEVLGQVGRRDPRFLLGGVGVELGPDAVEPVQDVEGAPLRRPLEQRMLDEVREPILAIQLIPRPCLDQQSAVPDVAPVLEMHTPNAVRQRPRVKSRRVGRHGPQKYAAPKGHTKKGGRSGLPFLHWS